MILLVAAVDPQAAEQCLETLHEDLWPQVLLVDNSIDGLSLPVDTFRPEPHRHPDRILVPERNIGVARSFNIGRARAVEQNVPLVWCSTSIRFGDAQGRDLPDLHPGWIGQPPVNMHLFAVQPDVLAAVGRMDENFFPAYWEDTDWLRRARLTGVPGLTTVEVDAVRTADGQGAVTIRDLNPGWPTINYDGIEAYYRRKWAGRHPDEKWVRPFRKRPLDWWEPATVSELIGRYQLGKPVSHT